MYTFLFTYQRQRGGFHLAHVAPQNSLVPLDVTSSTSLKVWRAVSPVTYAYGIGHAKT